MAVAQYNISSSGSNQIEGDILARTVHLMPDVLGKGHSQLREQDLDQCGHPIAVQSANPSFTFILALIFIFFHFTASVFCKLERDSVPFNLVLL